MTKLRNHGVSQRGERRGLRDRGRGGVVRFESERI
jgi:hypothetical protein